MSSFQSVINISSAAGVQGDQYDNSPVVSSPYTIVSSNEALNLVGATFCTVDSGVSTFAAGTCQAGGTGINAGLLISPNNYVSYGVGNQPLAPTMQVKNYSAIACATMGRFYAYLQAACNYGDWIAYKQLDGTIYCLAPNSTLPTGYAWANAIAIIAISEAGLGAIQLSPGLGVPV
jgi:hypothetical protein